MRLLAVAVAWLLASMAPAGAAELVLYGAGSLTGAMTTIATQFDKRFGTTTRVAFGPSGMMRERIEKGEHVDVFASADLGNPDKLVAAGRAAMVVLFARNRLCALARPAIGLSSTNFLDKALDPAIKLGTSTPKADPGGDYTWEMFRKADALRPGSFAQLDRKALKLVGGPQAVAIPAGRNAQAYLLAGGQADLFISYCTSAAEVAKQLPEVTVVELPKELAVAASYGLTVLGDAAPDASRLALYILSPEGQAILAARGFTAPTQR